MSIEIRPYRPADNQAVRRICCDTADAGRPLESLLGEPRPVPALRDLFADLLVAPYVERHARLVWVADVDGEAVGYVMGTLIGAASPNPLAIVRALVRGAFFRRSMLRLLWANRHGVRRPRHAPHLHVNLSERARGSGAGRRLVDRFLEQAKSAEIPAVTASVREDNTPARAFFEHLGFQPLERRPLYRTPSGIQRFAIIHGRQP